MLKRAVITGGAGFIGSNLARALVAEGIEVAVIDNYAGGKVDGRAVPEAQYHDFDIRDSLSFPEVFQGADAVFHLAALPRVQDSIDHPIETARTNVEGTLVVLEAARNAGVGKLVFSSSAAVYGDQDDLPLRETAIPTPKSPYGLQKEMGEQLCRLWSSLYGLPTVSLRYFNVYGPGFDPAGAYALVVGRFLDLRRRDQALSIAGDGSHTRDYVHVSDVVRANLLAAASGTVKNGEVINIGSGRETSVAELAALIGGPVVYGEPRTEPARSAAAIDEAQRLLGWRPMVDLDAGIRDLKQRLDLS